MTQKQAILLRLLLRGALLLMVIGVLLRGIFLRRGAPPEEKPADAMGRHQYATLAFDTSCTLTLYGDQETADQAAAEAIRLLNALHQTLNRYDEKSELARFNAAPEGTPFPCSELLWRAFLAAQEAYQYTDGVFDVTVGPLMAWWRKVAKNSLQTINNEELKAIQSKVGFTLLKLDGQTHAVTKTAAGMSVDFGGLAKGLALDLVREKLAPYALPRIALDFGGNLYLQNPDEAPNAGTVLVRDPRAIDHAGGTMLGRLLDGNHRCISTSANSERPLARGDKPIGHIMDPRTGRPATRLEQVTAITPRGVDSDVFSTAVFIAGPELAERLAAQIDGTGFVLLPPEAAPQTVGAVTFE